MPRFTFCYLISIGLCALGASGFVFAQEASPPKLKYVMTYQANLESAQPVAKDRLIFNATGGWLKMADGTEGTFINPCADWLQILPGGTFKLDVRCTIKIADGALIYMEYTGRIKLSKTGAEKFDKGESLSGDDAYFVASPTFHTMSEKFVWMNDAVFVNQWVETGANASYVKYDTYMVVP